MASAIEPRSVKRTSASRHSLLVRVTHWFTTLAFACLLWTGGEIVISHPRFYWGESGTVFLPALFQLPIPASRQIVPTGYRFVMDDQNGWSRALHFEAGWLLVLTGFVYGVGSIWSGHLREDVLPSRTSCSRVLLLAAFREHLHLTRLRHLELCAYNVLQRITYALVLFVLVPLAIWTGLAMSPGLMARFPLLVAVFGGQQSARTIHFFAALACVGFVVIHVLMVCFAGFKRLMGAMISGSVSRPSDWV